jgi:3-phytase
MKSIPQIAPFPEEARTALVAAAVVAALAMFGCTPKPSPNTVVDPNAVKPLRSTAPVPGDSDDPAIWFHPTDVTKSLILGTDKGGALYTFTLDGRMLAERTVTGLSRPNNVDVEQNVTLDGRSLDIAVVTERDGGRVRAFSLPEVKAIDGGGIDVFAGETGDRDAPMGVGLYKRPADGALFAIVSRKTGPADGYLWQYRVTGDGKGGLRFEKVREFGAFSGGEGEIEAIFVDDALGYVYYSDEWKGIRKYAADPDSPAGNRELALFGLGVFQEDREGLSLYALDEKTGYILASDQQAGRFRVYPREGTANGPHDHAEITSIAVSTIESDGSETTSRAMGPDFPHGLFIAMSEDKTFQIYRWEDLAAGAKLKLRP